MNWVRHGHGEVESADKSIDGLVYKLYGLSEDEISIFEKGDSQLKDDCHLRLLKT